MLFQKITRFLLKVMVPITEWVGRQHLPFTVKRITGRDFFEIQKALLPGDVLCTKVLGALSNLLIPGEYKHAAIYVGNNRVIEALGRGVCITDLVSFCMSKDFIIVRRPLFCNSREAEIAVSYAHTAVGKPYDYLFVFDMGENKAFYCSEVIWWSYEKALAGEGRDHVDAFTSPFVPRKSLGIDTVTPDDIAKADKKWSTIWKKGPDTGS